MITHRQTDRDATEQSTSSAAAPFDFIKFRETIRYICEWIYSEFIMFSL